MIAQRTPRACSKIVCISSTLADMRPSSPSICETFCSTTPAPSAPPSWAPPYRARALPERAATDIGGHNPGGPLGDVAADRIGGAQPQHYIPHDHLPQVDDDGRDEQRADDRGVPAALLGEDDGVGALARLDLGDERGARHLDRLRALRIGGGELGLVGVKKAVDDRRGEKLCEPLQHGINLRWGCTS